ncbi:helix-turn-helix transcriptional regulator [Roseovarius nubinhibens]|uniref:helix-turn-helix domain-containing protein n=1 Tax=Roseovarius nubinhibens TaxID=314263 RepID=UPI0030ECDF87|tara:strand:+ start:10899 stop:11279 length:381 start_codon:yes stop_codon:yes gene_type:complete
MRASFDQDLLRTARQARGWSQTQLSAHSGVSQANLSKLENGLICPTEDVLENFSEALGFSSDFFFQNDRVLGLPMSVQYRKWASVGQKAIERLEAELNIRILHIRRLLDAADLEPELSLPRLDVDD